MLFAILPVSHGAEACALCAENTLLWFLRAHIIAPQGGSVSAVVEALTDFQTYVRDHITGDEKGEAQVFLDRFFIAFGHKGHKEAGATLEQRIKKNDSKGTAFADLLWKPRVLIEMKKRGSKLQLHYRQAFDYWLRAFFDQSGSYPHEVK